MSTIAFIGLGNMGGPMAENLLKVGHKVQVFDLSADALARLQQCGAVVAETAVAAVAGAEYVITMLPAGKHVAAVYLDPDSGVLAHIDSKALIIDCSTIDVETVKTVAAAASAAGVAMIDAPVSGGVAAAAAGTLTFMCGGSEEHVDKARDVLGDMGKAIFRAGDHGAGQVAKMCNNMLLAVHMAGTAEALQMGVNNGLDPAVLSEIMLASSGRNWSLEVYNPYPGVMENAPASHLYKPGFMVQLMLKDLNLAMENSRATGSKVPMGSCAKKLYQSQSEVGADALDFSSVLQQLIPDS